MTPDELKAIEARHINATEDIQIAPRGHEKYYGVILHSLDWNNAIKIMGTQEDAYPEGDAAHSEREPEPEYSHNAMGNHYESKRDYDNAVHFATARADVLALAAEIRRQAALLALHTRVKHV